MQAESLLFFRAVLLETLLLHALYAPEAPSSAWIWALCGAYAIISLGLYWLGKKGRLSEGHSLWSFFLDIALASGILALTRGVASDFYVAYFLVILGSCFLQNLASSFIVGGVACLVYGALAFPGPEVLREPFYLLRLSLLLATAFFSTTMADLARRVERATAERFAERLAWMERLSMVGKAMAGVLHQAKTPLNTILLTAEYAREMLRRRRDAGEQLVIIAQEAERAAGILENFLEFAKPTELELKPLRLRETVLRVLDTMRISLEERGIEADVRLEEGLEVLGSEKHLFQVFTNLLSNALEAMPLGGRLLVRQEPGGRMVRIAVSDTGTGISRETLARLFEPFATSKEAGGHGLGLSVARWIVQKHSGEIEIASRGPGKGTLVRLTLPAARKS